MADYVQIIKNLEKTRMCSFAQSKDMIPFGIFLKDSLFIN